MAEELRQPRLVSFQPQYAEAFAALNYAWIERYFEVEQEDRDALEDPVRYAIEPGGEIFFVILDATVVGTVAMVPKSNQDIELAKMAVDPAFQGQGIANLLMEACLAFALQHEFRRVVLTTNSMLNPAVGLYRKYGFQEVSLTDGRYARGNLQMVCVL